MNSHLDPVPLNGDLLRVSLDLANSVSELESVKTIYTV